MPRTLPPLVSRLDVRSARPAPKRADAELQTPEHRGWRQAVLRLAGYQCQAIENGRRCTVVYPDRLFADHVLERKDGGAPLDVRNGQCLCGRHHTLKTNEERAKRMRQSFRASSGD